MFYWKYVPFNFIPFRFLVNYPREKYAELLQEGAITVWVDNDASFGYNALESMRCGNIVIGKIPETVPEWMQDENGDFKSNGLWVDDINTIPDVLASVINEWIEDEVSEEIYKAMDETNTKYTFDEWSENIDKTIQDIFNKRIEELESIKSVAKNKIKEDK
jgi:glycosyltransferase involved in cell wall biosynthesis